MTLLQIIEIFSLVSGLVYIVLEVKQHRLMWIVSFLSCVACAYSFAAQKLYASMLLNVYYVGAAVAGIIRWKGYEEALGSKSDIHLRKPEKNVVILSLVIFLFGTALLSLGLGFLGDSMTLADAAVTMLSVVATWWLVRSYPQQWLLWIVADLGSTLLCLFSGMYWMTALYAAYTAAAVFGWYYWNRKGEYIS